jgi:hypothetical protein
VHRIDRSIERVFGTAGLPETLTREQFARLAEIPPEALAELIDAGRVTTLPGTTWILAREYYRFACERNLREAAEDEETIAHVLASLW